jgi:hypothetical protein
VIKQILSADGGVISEVYVEDDRIDGLPKIVGFNTRQNCDPVLAEARYLRDMHGGHGADMKLVARIPVAFVDKLIREGRWNDQDELKKLVNDPEMRDFRVWQGQV